MAKATKTSAPAKPNPVKPAAAAKPATKKSWPGHLRLAILLGIISFLAYANTFKNDYALDDFTVIRDNRIVTKGISAIPEIFATPYRLGWFITTNDLYRPMSLAMFATEWTLFNKEPFGGHLMNVLVFVGCVIALFLFINTLFDGKKIHVAFIASLLFALHPIHTEVVANIKSRDELLCFFFCFMAMNVFMKYMKTGTMSQLLLGCVLFLCSFFSKETVITMVFVIPFIFFFYKNENRQRAISISAGAAAMAILFLCVRYAVLHKYNANTSSDVTFMDNFLSKPPSALSALATEILILGNYVRLLFVPYPLICDYSYNSIPFVNFGDIKVIVSIIAYAAMVVFAVMRFIKNKKDVYALGIVFFLVTISLFSNIPFLIGAPMAERFAFFASVGFCLIVAQVIDQFLVTQGIEGTAVLTSTKVLAVLAPIAIIYAGITFNRNTDWLNNITLFKADVQKVPEDARLTYYTGTELVTMMSKMDAPPDVKQQMVLEAITYLKRSVATHPQYTDAHASLGDAYFRIAKPGSPELDSAEVHGIRALELNPKYSLAINNLAGVYFTKNNIEKAMSMCRQAIDINPMYVGAYSNMGLCYLHLGKLDSSLFVLHKAMSMEPTFLGTYDNLILTFRALGKPDSVKKYQDLQAQYRGGGTP